MARIARMVVKDEPAVYHVMTRTALDGFVLGFRCEKRNERKRWRGARP